MAGSCLKTGLTRCGRTSSGDLTANRNIRKETEQPPPQQVESFSAKLYIYASPNLAEPVMRNLGMIDRLLDEVQHGLNSCHVRPAAGGREYPGQSVETTELGPKERARSAGLMRVNNAGEVAAQGLYRGQALFARKLAMSEAMSVAAEQENEHLNWCQRRLEELDGKRSILDGFWYWGAFSIGALAGAAGDKWSLGFVEETEKQVCNHLERHLQQLPPQDQRSHSIIEAMHADESRHAENARQAGAAVLPRPIKRAMSLVSKVMTYSAYRI